MRTGFASSRLLAFGAIAAGSAGVVLALAGIHSAARGPLVLLFLAVAPALAVAAALRGLDRVARIVVACTAAIVLNLLVAETLLAAGAWSPRAALVGIVVISAFIGMLSLPRVRGTLASIPRASARREHAGIIR